jgi:tetratricopeptide (TPR) repeat protein
MLKLFKRLSQPKQKDYFQEIEERVEKEAVGIRKRRKDIEQEALGGLASFGADVTDTMRTRLTAERLLNAGVWFLQQGKLIEAMAALHVAIEIDNSCWKAYYNLGWQYLDLGRKIMGMSTLSEESFSKSPTTQMSFYQAAMKYINKAIDHNPKDAKILCLLGQTQYYTGNYDQARATLGKAIALDPTGEGGRAAANALAILENSMNLK